jgi:hypothetical protein
MKIISLVFISQMILYSDLSYAVSCKENEVPVRAHSRTLKGRLIKVKASCRRLNNWEDSWWSRIKTNSSQIPLKAIATTPKQKLDIINALSELPAWAKKIGISAIEIDGFAATSSVNLITQTITIQEKVISNPAELKRVLIHEHAHLLFASLDPNRKGVFLSSAGWIPIDGKWILISREPVSVADSRESPDEHFSNSIEVYETNRLNLRKNNPLINSALEDILNE